MKHVVQYSTGAGSAEVAWRAVHQHGADNVVLLTADTRAEDADNWRFAHEVHGRLGCQWIVLADGRTPMEVGRDRRVVPNNRMAVCSLVLKRKLLRAYIDEHYDPADSVILLGYDWTEPERIAAAWPQWDPYKVAAPLADPPYGEQTGPAGAVPQPWHRTAPPVRTGLHARQLRGRVRARRAGAMGAAAAREPDPLPGVGGRRAADPRPARQGRLHPPRPHARHHNAAHSPEVPGAPRQPAEHVRRRRLGRMRMLHRGRDPVTSTDSLPVPGTQATGTGRYCTTGKLIGGVYGTGGGGAMNRGYKFFVPEAREAMGIDWMTWSEMSQAIPPAFTEFIGAALMAHIREVAA